HLLSTSPQIHENERVIALIEQLENAPKNPLLPLRIGQILFDQGRFAYAEYAFLYGAMRDMDASPTANAYIALSRQVQGKSSDAWMAFALEQGNHDAEIHHLHGLYLRDGGLYHESRDAFAKAVALDLN